MNGSSGILAAVRAVDNMWICCGNPVDILSLNVCTLDVAHLLSRGKSRMAPLLDGSHVEGANGWWAHTMRGAGLGI
jgi:hypothetical protein